MTCYYPFSAWRTQDDQVVFVERGRIKEQLTLSCGQCIGCRLRRSQMWAIRCLHESKCHTYNAFLTLTYNDEHLVDRYWTGQHYQRGPRAGEKAYSGNLHYQHVQAFNKRLIRSASRGVPDLAHTPSTTSSTVRSYAASLQEKNSSNIRFYMGAEYGEQYGRPHYHMCLFGAAFTDLKYLGRTPSGSKLWRSATLEKLWPHGFSSVGELNYETAAYTARYVMKKITGTRAKTHYEKIDHDTGEIIKLTPEFNQMSRATGIGKTWLQRFEPDVYPHGKVVIKGRETYPPRYYDKLFKDQHPTEWRYLADERQHELYQQRHDQVPHRLRAREAVAAAKIKSLKRKI